MEAKIVRTVKTKLNEDDKTPKVTVITWLTAGLTVDHLIEPALQTLTINKQGQYRRAKAIPQKEEVSVLEMIQSMGKRGQVPATVEGIAAVASTFTPEQRKELMAKLAADEKAAQNANKKGKKDGDTKGEQRQSA